MDEKEKKLLQDGEVIHVKDIVNKEGTKLYSGYVWQNKESGRLEFDFDHPNQEKSQKQTEIQKQGQGQEKEGTSTNKNAVQNGTVKKENTRKQK